MNPTLLSRLTLIPIPITTIAAIREDRGVTHLSVRSDGKLYRYQIRGSEAILIGIGGTAKPRIDAVDAAVIDEVYRKYRDTVNMSASELEEWADTEASGRASVDRSPIKRNLELLRTPKDQWTEKHVTWANRTISFVSRMSEAEQGKDVSKDVPYSKRDISLKNWAFDPGKSRGDAAEIKVGSTVRWNYGDGTGEGRVTRIYTEPTTLTIKGAEIKRNGTEENPAYEIEQEGGDRVLKLASEVQRVDASDPIRRRISWNGLELGITHEPEMYRFPGRMMLHSYGHVRGTYGKARDGKSIDCYWGDHPTGGAWRITQINPETGEEDEEKLMLGFPNGWEARQSFIYHAGAERFGGMVPMEESELGVYRRHVEDD